MSQPLDTPLLQLTDQDHWTWRDAFEGVAIFGATGSGKTTGSGAMLARSYLRAGFGGLILSAKSERLRWERYAEETGRSDDLLIVSPDPDPRSGHVWQHNFLDWEMTRQGAGAGQVETIVELLAITQAIVEGRTQLTAMEPFWNRASNALIRNVTHILLLSGRPLSVEALVRLILAAPRGDQADDPVFQRRSELWDAIQEADARPRTAQQEANFASARAFLLTHYARLAERTRSSIEATFTTIADVLLHDYLRTLFCQDTTFTPDMAFEHQRLILFDVPIREFGQVGLIAQRLFKTLFQRAVLRRDITTFPLPVFLWADEAQNFVDSVDYRYQAEARAARGATVYITQNISNYYATQGVASRDEVNALLGHFQTKLFHRNTDPATNQWAAEIIGQEARSRKSWSAASNEFGGSLGLSYNTRQEYRVEPTLFTTLTKGGPDGHWHSDAILFQGGRAFTGTGQPWLKVRFPQREVSVPPVREPGKNAYESRSENDSEPLESPAMRGRLFWRGVDVMQWMLLLRHQGDRIGEMVGTDELQRMLQKDAPGDESGHLVQPVWQVEASDDASTVHHPSHDHYSGRIERLEKKDSTS